jgi:hypothetical protein
MARARKERKCLLVLAEGENIHVGGEDNEKPCRQIRDLWKVPEKSYEAGESTQSMV